MRDQVIVLSRIPQDSSASANEAIYTGYIDHVIQDTDQSKIVYFTDLRAKLQVPLNRSLFPPNADPSVAGKPRTLSLGICRTYTGDLYDATNSDYAAHDAAFSALGIQRLAGK